MLRRIGRADTAQTLVLEAARHLQSATQLPDHAHHAAYGHLLAVAAYTAAIRDDRSTALDLLTEADTGARAASDTDRFNTLEAAVYRISIARTLGDYGAAVDNARKMDPRRIVDLERRALYWQDTALVLHGRGRPDAAFTVLQAAERDVPEEVRYRPWAQQLTRDLLASSWGNRRSGPQEFATRIGIS